MIAPPLKLTSLITELYLAEIPVSKVYQENPQFIESCFTDVPWFFFENHDLLKLEKENETYVLSDSAKRWNEIKLDIYYCLFYERDIFRQSTTGKRNNPTKYDWEYFVHFNTKQYKKATLWTESGWPRQFDDDTYWIDKEVQNIFFGEYNKTIDEAFINEPGTIDRLLCFDKDFFFDEENITKLIDCNPNYKLSNRALLWNNEKYNCWLERRREEEIISKQEWQAAQDAKELLNDRFEMEYDIDEEDNFNAMTDGKLGDFQDFSGDIDDIDNWSGK